MCKKQGDRSYIIWGPVSKTIVCLEYQLHWKTSAICCTHTAP